LGPRVLSLWSLSVQPVDAGKVPAALSHTLPDCHFIPFSDIDTVLHNLIKKYENYINYKALF